MIFYNLKHKVFSLLILMAVFNANLFSQDMQFSQFYNIPLYQNPAFAGSSHEARAIVHQRIQWPKLDAKYITSVASFDKYFMGARSGIGIMALQDFQGSNTISSTELSGLYSYELHVTPTFTIRSGLQLNYVTRYLDYAKLTYPHNFNDFQQISQDPDGGQRIHYLDLATGFIFYSKNLWIGLSGHHLNLPNQSFDKGVARLPGKFAITGGYKFLMANSHAPSYSQHSKEVSITPTFHYKFQGLFDQFDLGAYFVYDQLHTGIWYRGIPMKPYDKRFANNESFVMFFGWKWEAWKFGYSYDLSVSRLARETNGGGHEFNITYLFLVKYKKKKPMRRMPCPNI